MECIGVLYIMVVVYAHSAKNMFHIHTEKAKTSAVLLTLARFCYSLYRSLTSHISAKAIRSIVRGFTHTHAHTLASPVIKQLMNVTN